jgi:hypothetical protein
MASPTFTYTPNIPQASQKISATQMPIQNNFSAINELIGINHVGFTDATNYGMHIYTSFPTQASDPSTASGTMAVYSKATPSGPNAAEIFYRYPSDGTVVQLTGGGGNGTAASSGYSYLSSTLFMMWGTASVSSSASTTITFPTGGSFPVFSTVPYQIYFTAGTNYTNYAAGSYIASSTTTNFVFTVPGANYATSIYWMALGV